MIKNDISWNVSCVRKKVKIIYNNYQGKELVSNVLKINVKLRSMWNVAAGRGTLWTLDRMIKFTVIFLYDTLVLGSGREFFRVKGRHC